MPKLLAQAEIDSALTSLDGWAQVGNQLSCDFKFSDFRAALQFVNAVGDLAEKAQHHPDMLLHDYKHVRVTLTTHDAGGITGADANLAVEIDQLITATRSGQA